ncbi:uncharacterized protein [Littorina saxatilis]|uniref:Secreted protein n=1 Tax=Littorina saxatilis TaxID=31220 RepID=A0AAN9GA52_9CAEN
MMTRTVVVLLIVCAMLVADCDSWRRGRKLLGTVLAVGKRDARCADLLAPDQVQQLATDLKNTCANIPVNLATDSLNLEEVKDVFTQNDADGDEKLLNAELGAFSAAIQTIEACAAGEADDKP